jgi:hypothetical protein
LRRHVGNQRVAHPDLDKLFNYLVTFARQTLEKNGEDPSGAGQKCSLEGIASDAATSEILRKVVVDLAPSSGSGTSYRTMTDASGHFAFKSIAPGEYSLHGERGGYLDGSFGARRFDSKGTILRLRAGETLSDLYLKLTRASVISGKLTDDSGEPVASAWVNAYQQTWMHGHREYVLSQQGPTNDVGEYRITGLPAGHYYVHAESSREEFVEEQGKPEKRLMPAFYPDSQTPTSANLVEVPAGNASCTNLPESELSRCVDRPA